jgi:hypothetical protein
MGSISETIFETWAKTQGWIVERSGANKSQLNHRIMNFYLRNQPDYKLQTPKGIFHVEVKGGDSDQVKVKLDSLEAGRYWDMFAKFCFFFTNTNTNEFAAHTLSEVKQIILEHRIGVDRFPRDGNAYHPVPKELFRWHPFDTTLLQIAQSTGHAAAKG